MPRSGVCAGLSPRTRRNLSGDAHVAVHVGPISANAEEPSQPTWQGRSMRAYLRERGGTQSKPRRPRSHWGLSPRTRRNPPGTCENEVWNGPISANAEEPNETHLSKPQGRAYLRERGGTLVFTCPYVAWLGPISANAEEPPSFVHLNLLPGAYLRERGGTKLAEMMKQATGGLSPRTRRNPRAGP